MTEHLYNPLDKLNLARSIEQELLGRSVNPLSSLEHIKGAGVYAIYYTGSFPVYGPVAKANSKGSFALPIYVGKAIPQGGRKGGLTKDACLESRALLSRLRNHANSVKEAANLQLEDFFVRHLIVDDIWIPLGENMLIETFKPVWNRVIDGFGNNDPGQRRATQYKSSWDVLHPGRKFAKKLANGGISQEWVKRRVQDFFLGRPLAAFPKKLIEQNVKQDKEQQTIVDQRESSTDIDPT